MTSFTKLLTAAAVIGGVAAPAVAQTPYPYGYPQQQPAYPQPAPGQPGYGYPMAPPVPQYGYGGQMEMPGLMKTARVFLFILGGLQLLAGVFIGIAVGAAQDVSNGIGSGDSTDGLAGLGFVIAVLGLLVR